MNNKCAVIVSRNDNYGENLIHRAQHSLNNLSEVFDKIIYVDWKSKDRSLANEIKINKKIEVINITKEIIEKNWPNLINLPIVEVLGRNIGIRKALDLNYEWICSTNIDIMMEKFEHSHLNKDTLYTARRKNIPIDVHLNFTDTNSLYEEAIKNKSNYKQVQHSVVDGKAIWDEGDVWSLIVSCGDFQLAHRDLWIEIKGFEESMIGRSYADSNLMKKPIMINKKTSILEDIDIFHLNHSEFCKREEKEYLPINDKKKFIIDWKTSTNIEDWGNFIE